MNGTMDTRQKFINARGDRIEIGADKITMARISIGKLREAIQANLVLSGPGMIEEHMPTAEQLMYINLDCQHAVNSGQVIDFGYWPNDLIKNTSMRAGKLYNERALGHPFASSWIYLHTWDSPMMGVINKTNEPMQTAYLVSPFTDELGCSFEALELEAFIIAGKYTLGVGDRVVFNSEYGSEQYNCGVKPAFKRFPIDDIALVNAVGIGYDIKAEMSDVAAACNVIDPLMTALMILNTRGVRQETVPAPHKLNKHRLKAGRPAIAAYRRVDSSSYVTAFKARQEGSRAAPGHGGHHASPIPHIRIGHWRNYETGKRSYIRDTLVNVPPELREQFLAKRSHYKAS